MRNEDLPIIGVMTWHDHCNCGGNLQAYALKVILNRLGFRVKFISYTGQNKSYLKVIKRRIRRVFSYYFKNFKVWRFDRFQKIYLPETISIRKKDLVKLNKKFNIFICGSDQIWAPNLFDSAYFLDFVLKEKKKIAYAASIGTNYIPQKLLEKYAQLLRKFDFISVREKSAEVLLRENCKVDSCTVLDPTLLLEESDYEGLEETSVIKENYIFCYFLNQNNWYCSIVKKIASVNNCKLVIYSLDKNNSDIADKWIDYIYPELFLTLIHNAKAVITDSYHGTIFSIIYQKSFMNLLRFEEDDPICQNSRIYDLLGKLGLEERIVDSQSQESALAIFEELNYDEIEKKLYTYRQNAFQFLTKSLSEL